MTKRRLLWQLYPSYLLILIVSLLAITLFFSRALRTLILDQISRDLEARARLIEDQVPFQSADRLQAFCQKIGRETATRLTLIHVDGAVLCDSHENPQLMENHGTRPEVVKAFQGKVGRSTRYSQSAQMDMTYVAVPLYNAHKIAGVVRTSVAVAYVNKTIRAVTGKILFGGFVIALFAAAVSFHFSRKITLPLEAMRKGAERFARGDLQDPLPIPHAEELANLANALNQMARDLSERISREVRQRFEKESILSSMVEGVVAVDTEEKVISMNQAAADLFEVDLRNISGRRIFEIVRNSQLQGFFQRTLASETTQEGEIVVKEANEKWIQAYGTVLRDAQANRIGALVVLNDATRIKRLENMRKDFVANVSHELKTPITSIKGFVETLLDGAYKDVEDAKRFLGIILKHAHRLNDITDDLLSLSRIEDEEREGAIDLRKINLRPIVENAIQFCETRAREKEIHIDLICPKVVQAPANAHLLEQALVNLIDNAIKYSVPKRPIQIRTEVNDTLVSIAVQDQGFGISEEHLPRLFERFYRVDKSRSRELGGTGLGLAIVKHIVQAHHGSIHVESTLGKGSTFTVNIPLT